ASSTLFTYTTLFRSIDACLTVCGFPICQEDPRSLRTGTVHSRRRLNGEVIPREMFNHGKKISTKIQRAGLVIHFGAYRVARRIRSEEHTSELQSRFD